MISNALVLILNRAVILIFKSEEITQIQNSFLTNL